MSTQPDRTPVPAAAYAPAPGAPAEILALLRADRRAERWVPAFEAEWAQALEESRRTFAVRDADPGRGDVRPVRTVRGTR